jgi:hypothetical protein
VNFVPHLINGTSTILQVSASGYVYGAEVLGWVSPGTGDSVYNYQLPQVPTWKPSSDANLAGSIVFDVATLVAPLVWASIPSRTVAAGSEITALTGEMGAVTDVAAGAARVGEADALASRVVAGAEVVNAARIGSAQSLWARVWADAQELIAAGETAGRAVSRIGSEALGVESPAFVNFTRAEIGTVPKFAGVEAVTTSGGELFAITDTAKYMERLEELYTALDGGMNVLTRQAILERISGGGTFETIAGLPGAHAEVRATNWFFNNVSSTLPADTKVATFALTGEKAGLPFGACSNCSVIVPRAIDIITGRRP